MDKRQKGCQARLGTCGGTCRHIKRKDMTLQQLEYIVAVYQMRHFSKAAEMCRVTQPTLSSMVQKLEDELDVKIFDRSTQPVTPTPVGHTIIEQAWKVILRARRIKGIAAEAKKATDGTFRIGILPTIAPYLLPRFLPQLISEHPEMNIHVIEMKTEEMKRALARGEIDAGIAVAIEGLDHLVQTPLFYEQFIAYVSRNDTLFDNKNIRIADLRDEFIWMLGEGHCFSNQLVKFCKLKGAQASERTYSLGSIETYMRMVENGKGITFIPELALLQLTESQRELVRPFAIPIPTRHVVMLSTKFFVRKTALDIIINKILSSVPQNMLTLNNTEQRV